MGNKKELNPVMNAVCEAFSRRRWQGSFRAEGRSIELDTLLFDDTKGDADDDNGIPAASTRKTESRSFSRRKLPPNMCAHIATLHLMGEDPVPHGSQEVPILPLLKNPAAMTILLPILVLGEIWQRTLKKIN